MAFAPPSAGEMPSRQPVARPLIPLVAALAAGLAVAGWGVVLPSPVVAISLAAIFAGLILAWWTGRLIRLLPLVFVWLVGVAFYHQAMNPRLPAHHVARLTQEQEVCLLGRLYVPPQVRQEKVRLFLEAAAWCSPTGWQPVSGKVLITSPALPHLPPEGTDLIVRVRLRTPRDLRNPGSFKRKRYLAAKGIYREGRLKQPGDLIMLAPSHDPGLRQRLRMDMRRLLVYLPHVPRALYLALILGDQGEITPDMRQAFGRTGTSHLLAISGLHLGMVAALSFVISFWLLRLVPWLLLRINAIKLAAALSAGPVITYAWIAGGSPSTQRAEIMILAYLLMVLVGRPREVPSALALAALLILSLSPLLLFTLSFQLSFLSVAALLYFLPRWVHPPDPEMVPPGRLKKWSRRPAFWLKGALFASLVATLATAPLVAAAFHVVSFFGIVLNLVAIPLINGMAVPLGLLALKAEFFHLTPLAKGFLALGQVPLELAYGAISWGAALPGSALILPTPTWLQMMLFYALLLLLFPPRRMVATWTGAALAAVILTGSILWPQVRTSQACEVTCLDSYTGLAGVVVAPDNRRLVVSAGWPSWPGRGGGAVGPLPAYLHWRQFRRLDEVMALSITSYNAPELLRLAREFRLGAFWFGRGDRGPEIFDLRNYLGDIGRSARSLVRGQPPATLGEVGLTYHVLEGWRAPALRIAFQGRTVMLMPPSSRNKLPDSQQEGLGPLGALIVPGDPSPEWVKRLRPQAIIIYGSPERRSFRNKDPEIPRHFTRNGAVSLYLSKAGVSLRQWRP